MTRHSEAGAITFWLLLSAVLAGLVAFEVSNGLPLAPTVTAATIGVPAAVSEPAHNVTVSQLAADAVDAIIERPLFSASRRPVEPTANDQPTRVEDPVELIPLRLVGTMLTGNSRIALLQHPGQGLLRLGAGQDTGGWLVETVDQGRVRVRHGDQVKWLTLRDNDHKASASGSQPPNARTDGRGIVKSRTDPAQSTRAPAN